MPSLLAELLVPSFCHKLSFQELNPEFLVAVLLLRLYGCLLDSFQGLAVDDFTKCLPLEKVLLLMGKIRRCSQIKNIAITSNQFLALPVS
ncbi:hypothetical protein TNCT_490311 [Trichonephila clavata]|uniref:Uncharacterized protein n=1 Tax=Trichonephila clavata TaxID=2740835 RepID=A0A8X6GIC3_TRICU|nr:hypothetical protein TNCT_490311 [Trichonephila clavata]